MEILQDTIIQTQFRRGTNAERLSVLFKEGEPAYTTDFHRLYMGDGVTTGGNLIGNLYNGEFTPVNDYSTTTVVAGDMRYDPNNSTLYVYKGTVVADLSSWKPISNLSNPIYAKYNGLSGASLEYGQQTTVTRLSAGHYKVIFPSLPSTNYIPLVQIDGTDDLGYFPRTINRTLSSCDVVVLSSNGSKTDANIYFTIQN